MNYRVLQRGEMDFKAQCRPWWSPFWIDMSRPTTRENAEKIIDSDLRDRKPWRVLWSNPESKLTGGKI